ncbi:protein kinase [Trichormus azollae]|uniref:protein kinase n=1 Tax=Trichormus azollae TaxID=1164 RepID=UPI00325FBEFD
MGMELAEPEQIETVSLIQEEDKKPKITPTFLSIIQRLLDLSLKVHKNLQPIAGYKLIKSLEKGAFGEVLLAEYSQLRKYVAIKEMIPAVVGKEEGVEMFPSETENTRILTHLHIAQLLNYGFAEETFFFVMEYCEGDNIWDFMQKLGWRVPINRPVRKINFVSKKC